LTYVIKTESNLELLLFIILFSQIRSYNMGWKKHLPHSLTISYHRCQHY
jgi:hypothetical protein